MPSTSSGLRRKNIFDFGVLKSLRAFQNPFFTGGGIWHRAAMTERVLFLVKTAKLYFIQVQFSRQFCKRLQKT